MEKVIVTRHTALVDFLREQGIEGDVVSHASEETVKGKHVFGVLPMRLAALCGRFTEVTLQIPAELRGKELSLQDINACNPVLTDWIVRPEHSVRMLKDCIYPSEDVDGVLAQIVRLDGEGWRMIKAGE